MDKHTGQTPFTDEELAQALRLGTDAAARRQGALRAVVLARVQNPERRHPLWQTLAVCTATVVLLVAAAWALASRLPQWDVVQPLATNTPQVPAVTLTTNIQRYTPAMSSAQGITITARDSLGNPLSGDWKTSWGVFLGPVSEQGNLIPIRGDYTSTWQNSARVMWSFAPDAGETPAGITITFTAPDGHTAVLHLARDGENTGFVRVVQQLGPLNLLVGMDTFCGDPRRNLFLPLRIQATDAQGNAVNGDWSASYGAFGDAAMSGNNYHIENLSNVQWYFLEQDVDKVPDTATITFIATDGQTRILPLFKDPDNPWTLRVSPQDLLYIPSEPADTHPVKPTASAAPLPTGEPSPTPSNTPPPLPEWTRDVRYQGQNLDLATDAEPEKYLATPTQWQDQTTVWGTQRLPSGWSVSSSRKDLWLKLLDESGQEMGTLEYNWLDASLGQEAYLNAIANHTELISFQRLQGSSFPTYRLLLEADNGTAASGIPGVTVQSETVYIPGTILQKDGNYYYEVYILRLYKARTGDGDTKYLLNNQTIDVIADSWKEPQTGLTPYQAIESFFADWDKKDLSAMNACLVQPLEKNADMEFDALKSIGLLNCTDVTQQQKGLIEWPANTADALVFQVTFDVQYKDGMAGAMDNGTNSMNFYLMKETASGHWLILSWGNG